MEEQDSLVNKRIKKKIPHERRYESMLFEYGTTAMTDFRGGRIEQPKLTKYKEKVRRLPPKKHSLKSTQTLTDWIEGNVRFDLFMKPKEIVQTDPRKIQEYEKKPEDTGRAEAQRTRPRLVMTPAVSMDDIEDPKTRDLLCNDIYTSTAVAGMREGVRPYYRVEAPLSLSYAKANPVVLPKLNMLVVPDEWRMESVAWDSRQLRCSCDPTLQFWLRNPLHKCRACDASALIQKHRDAKRLAKRQQFKKFGDIREKTFC